MIVGDPTIVNRHMIFPAPRASIRDATDFASIGMAITGMPALHAVGPACAAPAGMLTSADLPLRAFAGRFGS